MRPRISNSEFRSANGSCFRGATIRFSLFTIRHSRSAVTMIEAVLSLVLISGLLVVSLNTVGASTMGQSKMGDRGRAQLLAFDLMNEILEQEYQDPTETVAFGPEPLDTGPGRSGFDDVDDYRAYSVSPPQHRDGTVMTDFSGWTEQVTIGRVNALTPWQSAPLITDTGVKKITVTIKKGSATLMTLTALRAQTNPISPTGGGILYQW